MRKKEYLLRRGCYVFSKSLGKENYLSLKYGDKQSKMHYRKVTLWSFYMRKIGGKDGERESACVCERVRE